MNWKELECTGSQCNHETSETHYIFFDRDIKHSQQQLLESLELEVEKMRTYTGGSSTEEKYFRVSKPGVKALIQEEVNKL